MRIAHIPVILVLVQNEPKTVIATHKLVKFGRAGRNDRHVFVDFDNLDILDRLLVFDLDDAVKLLNRAAVTLLRLSHVAGVQNVALTGASDQLKQVILDHLDINGLEGHVCDRCAVAVVEVLRAEDINPVDVVAVPVVVEKLGVAQ